MTQKQQELSPELLKKREDQNKRKAASRKKQEQRLKDRGATKFEMLVFRGTRSNLDELKALTGFDEGKEGDSEFMTIAIRNMHRIMTEEPGRLKKLMEI